MPGGVVRLTGHAEGVHVHGQVGVVVDVSFLGRFTENAEGTQSGELGVEEEGGLAVGRAREDVVDFWVPVDGDQGRARRDRRDKLWAECGGIEDVKMACFGARDDAGPAG